MKAFRKIVSIIMVAAVLASVTVAGTISSGATGTGIGLAEWAFKAYNEGWVYSWGGATPGAVDCSGLIYSYCGGNRTSMLADAQANGRDWGYVSNGIPNIHGLGLSRPGHVGVYVGGGMEIDARGTGYNMCYQSVGGSWSCWFKLTAVSYPTTGWQSFNGSYYYYENGEYLADTSRTIDGVTYYFSSSGVSSTAPGSGSSANSNSGSSSSSSSANNPNSASATTAPTEDTGSLKNGSQGARVEKLQTRLQELGYYHGLVDGDFGDLTEKAFKLFQKQAGLYVDGIAGSDADYLYSDDAPYYVEETKPAEQPTQARAKKKLELASTAANEAEEAQEDAAEAEAEEPAEVYYTVGDYNDEIVTIQERLIKLGYLDGGADGSFGTLTENAVKAFQSVNKLEETGSVDQETYDKMFSTAAVKSPMRQSEEPEQQIEEATVSPIAATTAGTEVERTNSRLAAKAVASVTDGISARAAANPNLEFILWLAIMIVVMLFAFIIVYSVEKKKARAMARAGRRFM